MHAQWAAAVAGADSRAPAVIPIIGGLDNAAAARRPDGSGVWSESLAPLLQIISIASAVAAFGA